MSYQEDQLRIELEQCRKSLAEMEAAQGELRDMVANLRKSEEKYRSIFEEAIEGIFQTSVDGRFINANPSLAGIHGYDSPQDLMESITDISKQLYVHPEDRLRLIKKIHTQGPVTDFETQM